MPYKRKPALQKVEKKKKEKYIKWVYYYERMSVSFIWAYYVNNFFFARLYWLCLEEPKSFRSRIKGYWQFKEEKTSREYDNNLLMLPTERLNGSILIDTSIDLIVFLNANYCQLEALNKDTQCLGFPPFSKYLCK